MSGSPVYVILGEHGGVSGMPGGKRMRKEREELEDLRDELAGSFCFNLCDFTVVHIHDLGAGRDCRGV